MNFEIAPKETKVKLNWNDARLYCFSLNIDGKTGWRLPTKEELNEIYKSENDFENWGYWTSTEVDNNFACGHNFTNGFQFHDHKTYSGHYVRAIRPI